MMRHTNSRSSQHGLSMVELLVGVTVGLFIIAGSAMLVATQLSDNRRLLIETQLQQDLRAAADIITRDLRRAGFYQAAQQVVWTPDTSTIDADMIRTVSTVTSTTGVSTRIDYSYEREPMEKDFGFLRDTATTSLRSKLAGGTEQDLTDPKTLNITSFTISPLALSATQIECPKLCSDGTKTCWPSLNVRAYLLTIKGQSRLDPAVKRTLRTEVRLRNDYLRPNPVLLGNICPT